MITVTLNVPTEKLALVQSKVQKLTDPDGPLAAVGEYVCSIGMPGFFRAGGNGWAAVLRGGTPLIDEGELVAGFGHEMGSDGKSIIITNTGRPSYVQSVLHSGKTITATNAPYLKFKIGDEWVMKKSVTIPARPFWLWFQELQDNAVEIATQRMFENLQEALA